MDIFKRPYIESIYGGAPKKIHHPYDRQLFKEYSVFPLLPLDTGAFLLCMDKFNGADGDTLLRGVENGTLFKPWTHQGKFDWDLHFKQTSRSAMRNLVEYQAWINRLYMLPPVAQQFFKTKDEAWARKWYALFSDWEARHPFKETICQNFYKESDLVWFDMQICWRSLNLMHSAYLLADSKYLTKAHWKRVYKTIEFGVNRLLKEATKELASSGVHGNHFLQKGAALLYAGICFPEFGRTDEFIKTGKAIIKKMMEEEIFADGGSVEASPSYCLFIARQYVDAYVLMNKNGVPMLDGLFECIQKQYRWISLMASPERRTLQFNDSCVMDVDTDLDVVSKVFPLKRTKPVKSILLPTSQMGKLSNRTFEVYFDATPPQDRWHDHHGKPNLVIYCEGEPLVVDSGCPNYDHFMRETYMTRSAAHNVLQIHEKPEFNCGEGKTQRFPTITVDKFEPGKNRSKVVFRHAQVWPEMRLDYVWTRTVILEEDALSISDRVVSKHKITATQRFHFAPLNMQLAGDRGKATLFFKGRDIHFEQTNGPLELEYKPAYDQWNKLTYTPCLKCTARGTTLEFKARISL